MIKRLLIVLAAVTAPLAIGLLFTYEVIKIDWISFMEIQPSFIAQEAPLPMPPESVPVQGAAYIPGPGAPVNPVPADAASLERGAELYAINCALCHGAKGEGNGTFSAFLIRIKPANLLQGRAFTDSDGYIFQTITDGIEGAMPNLRENLDVRARWDVVNYVRQLQGK